MFIYIDMLHAYVLHVEINNLIFLTMCKCFLSKFNMCTLNMIIHIFSIVDVWCISKSSYVTRVRRRDNHPPGSRLKKTRNSCSLSVKKRNGSHHLIFWSLETLTGLRGQAWGLVAWRKGISTPNMSYLR
jgi:hypothetical protein